MNPVASLSLGAFAFLLTLGIVMWSETAAAVFGAMVEAGFLLCQ
ncbi:hypothetical protein [Acuticoccus kalidii]|nr:hypothetical protein [Acuticoccus kalidii]